MEPEPFQKEHENGINVVFPKMIKGTDQTLVEVAFTSQAANSDFHDAPGALQAQMALGNV
jgi:hypothetical protein